MQEVLFPWQMDDCICRDGQKPASKSSQWYERENQRRTSDRAREMWNNQSNESDWTTVGGHRGNKQDYSREGLPTQSLNIRSQAARVGLAQKKRTQSLGACHSDNQTNSYGR